MQGAGFRVQGSGFRVQGSGFRVPGGRHRAMVTVELSEDLVSAGAVAWMLLDSEQEEEERGYRAQG